MTMPGFASTVRHIVSKDCTVEFRSREIAYTTVFFAVSCVLIFAFALVREGRAPEGAGEGILWATVTFAGTLASSSISRSSVRSSPLNRAAANRSGRRSRVARSASLRRQRRTRPWSPESSTSGTPIPRISPGRV